MSSQLNMKRLQVQRHSINDTLLKATVVENTATFKKWACNGGCKRHLLEFYLHFQSYNKKILLLNVRYLTVD